MSDLHHELASLLGRAVDDPFIMARLRRLAEETVGLRGYESDAEVVEAVAAAASRGRLGRGGMLDDTRVGSWTATTVAGEEAPDDAAGETDETITHAIQFKVVDDETGDPCANVALTVKLTTGETRRFTTDGNGMVRISGIPGGSCDITRMVDAEAFEVVAVESA